MKKDRFQNIKALIKDICFVAMDVPFIVTSTLAFIYITNKNSYDTFFTPMAFIRAFANFIDVGNLVSTAIIIVAAITISTFIRYLIDKKHMLYINDLDVSKKSRYRCYYIEILIIELQKHILNALALSVGIICARVIIFVWHPIIVDGDSMNPTYTNGEILITTTSFDIDDISVGDVIAFRSPKLHNGREGIIKRVVGVPGDSLYIQDGLLYVNGEIIEELQYNKIEYLGCLKEEIILKDYEFFCMGDNRNLSTDCRFIGPIQYNNIEHIIIRKMLE